MIAPRYLKLLSLFKPGESLTAPEIAQLTNIPRNRVTNGLCILIKEGYLERVKNNTGRKGRVIYALRPDVALPEGIEECQFGLPDKRPYTGRQTWFSPIM